MVFSYLDEQGVVYSESAIASAAATLRAQGKLHRESDVAGGQAGTFRHGGTTFLIHAPRTNQTPTIPSTQRIEIVDRVKRITLADVRRMSAQQYDEALKNPSMREQIDALLANS